MSYVFEQCKPAGEDLVSGSKTTELLVVDSECLRHIMQRLVSSSEKRDSYRTSTQMSVMSGRLPKVNHLLAQDC